MTNTRKSRRNGRRGPRRTRNSAPNRQFQRDLVEIERTQQRSLPPQVKDVIKVMLPRERLIMFERTVSAGTISTSSTLDTFGSYRMTLDSLPNYTEFTNLFDAYRIIQMTVCFFPAVTMSATVPFPPLYTVIDYDDDTNLTAVTQAFEYPTLQQSVAGSVVERTFNPCAANAAYSGAFTSYARMPRSTWVDVASPGVRYYALKWALPQATTAQTLWNVTIRVVFQCKNVR